MSIEIAVLFTIIVFYLLIGALVVIIYYDRDINQMRHRIFDNPMSIVYYIIIWPGVMLGASL